MLDDLRHDVCRANRQLETLGLATLTWGNVSALDPDRRLFVIKPSGVAYADLTPESLVVLDLDGRIVEGELNPSSDMPSHLALYQAFPGIAGVAHAHSPYATAFAQAHRAIPCLGTTHADHFHGEVPVTRCVNEDETAAHYERATGDVIVEHFADLDPLAMPAALVAGHGPFCWGRSAQEALDNAVALEAAARMAFLTLTLDPQAAPLPRHLLDKHFLRKHGDAAYYGQGE